MNNSQMNYQWVKEEMKIEIKYFLKFNENESMAYPNLGNTMKAVLRRKFIALGAYIKNLEKSHTSDLTAHLKALEKKETNSSRRSRQQEIIKFQAEISKIEIKNNTKNQ